MVVGLECLGTKKYSPLFEPKSADGHDSEKGKRNNDMTVQGSAQANKYNANWAQWLINLEIPEARFLVVILELCLT